MTAPFTYLLDTNILSHLIRDPRGTVANKIAEAGEKTVYTGIIDPAELRYGASKSGSRRLSERINLILSALTILPFQVPADRHYAEIRHQLTRRGKLIGPNDMLIAAHALTAELTLVTANIGEFSRVPGLRVVNWLAE